MSHVTLKAQALNIQAGDLRLLSDLSFTVSNGEALIIRGANGIGKTSLLRVLAGLALPRAGSVSLGDADQSDQFDLPENTHFLGHKNGLKLEQSVRENLSFFSEFLGGSKDQINTVLADLNLTKLQFLKTRLLSAGQARRMGFTRLRIAPRKVWLLDEPTASLDSQSSQLIENICHGHLDQGGILIAATHLPFLEGRGTTLDLEKFVPSQKWVDG